MNIKILHLIEGAKAATGTAVIIDVFRAFTVEAYLINNNAEKVIPVGDKQIAYDYKKQDPDAVLIGERHGVMLEGFNYGNSPSAIENVDFTGKTVVHTTSAGTQGIDNAVNSGEILTGSLVNAKATAEYIKKSGATDVSLVCMGLEGLEKTDEDIICAEYIKSLLLNEDFDLTTKINNLKYTSGAKFFDEAQQRVFPKKDFYLSTEPDKFDFALKLVKERNGFDYIKKIQ